jgi:hypothetical protein
MAEGPAEGEWEEDAGMGAAAAERRREKALEREKAKQLDDANIQPTHQKVCYMKVTSNYIFRRNRYFPVLILEILEHHCLFKIRIHLHYLV